MKYVKLMGVLFATVLFATAVVAAPSTNDPVATADSTLGTWTLSLAGNGSANLGGSDIDGSAVGGEFQLGRAVTLVTPAEIGIRQGIGWSDVNGSSWLFSTKAYSDWTVLRLGNLQFDAGGNVGLTYGNTKPVWTAAPEVVARLYLKKDVDVFTRVEYPFDLTDGKAADRLGITLGLRVRF